MPPTCIAPGCDSGNPRKQVEGEHRHFFAIPKDDFTQAKWKDCLPVKEIKFTKNSKICDLHFEEEFILRYYETVINGETVKLARGKVSLAEGAYPTKFPNLDNYLAKKPRKRKKLLKEACEMEQSVKQVALTAPLHYSKLEEITDQVEATKGIPPQLPPESVQNVLTDGVLVTVVDAERLAEDVARGNAEKKNPITVRFMKARDRVYYLTRNVNRLKKRICEMKVENRKLKKQVIKYMEALEGLKSLPPRQQLIFEQAILQTQQKRGGMRYSPEWIADCIQLKIRSSSVYEYLRRNQYMPLPNPGTLYNFVKQRKIDLGISLQLLETLKEKNPSVPAATDVKMESDIVDNPLDEEDS